MAFRLLALLFMFLFPTIGWTTITITAIDTNTISGGEGVLFGNLQAVNNTIYGGYAGACDASTTTSTSTCTSCIASNGSNACNDRRIHDDLELRITILYEDDSFDNTIRHDIMVSNDVNTGSGPQQKNIPLVNNFDNIAGPGTFTIAIRWEEICNVVFGSTGDAGCLDGNTFSVEAIQNLRIGVDKGDSGFLGEDGDDFTTDLRVGIATLSGGTTSICTSSSSSTGACNFDAFPGDSKVYIDSVRADCSFPSVGSSVDLAAVRAYYHDTTENNTVPTQSTSTYADLALSGDNQDCDSSTSSRIIGLTNNEVGGLINENPYLFSIGLVDVAGNVGLVTTNTNTGATENSECFIPGDSERNCHRATPEAVEGLLDELDCFITTAAYGSPFEPKVRTFRAFRNRFLKSTALGRLIIQTYYKTSPPLAKWIDRHPKVKPIVRFLLWPLWFFAKLCLQSSWLVFTFFIGLSFILVRKKLQRVDL